MEGIIIMSGPLTEVICRQDDCVYHQMNKQAGKVYCSHAEKAHYLNRVPCPLYRMDWQKKTGAAIEAGAASSFLKVIKKPVR